MCSISHASADAHPYERRGTVLELVASGKNRRAQGLVCLSAGWDLLEGQLATQDTWPLVVAALLAHQRVWKGVEMEIRLCIFCVVVLVVVEAVDEELVVVVRVLLLVDDEVFVELQIVLVMLY